MKREACDLYRLHVPSSPAHLYDFIHYILFANPRLLSLQTDIDQKYP